MPTDLAEPEPVATVAPSAPVAPAAPPRPEAGPPTDPGAGGRRVRSGIIVGAIAAVVAIAVVVAVVVTSGGDGGGSATPVRRDREPSGTSMITSTSTTRATVPPTPPVTAPAPTTVLRGPQNYTVVVDCGGRTCTLVVRDAPSAAAAKVSTVDSGTLLPIACVARGQNVVDGDNGQQSDLWLRLDGSRGFISALYAQGPPVPSC